MPIFGEMYYTKDILVASLIASGIVAIVYGLQELSDRVFSSIITQGIILFILYFIIFFIAIFALINPFLDFLLQKMNGIVTILIILVIANGVLLAGLYTDSSRMLTDVLATHLNLFLATNIAMVYVGWRKSLGKGKKTA